MEISFCGKIRSFIQTIESSTGIRGPVGVPAIDRLSMSDGSDITYLLDSKGFSVDIWKDSVLLLAAGHIDNALRAIGGNDGKSAEVEFSLRIMFHPD